MLGTSGWSAVTPLVTALTVGVTTAKNSACKRGVATNIAASLARHSAVSARVPQLWGRAEPNRGFGAALAIPELDAAVYDLFAAFRGGRDHQRRLLSL
jgi:hypothetical protein